jgi:UDP-N-acetylglucosamine:LPS N-acetylglucosamine transferase
MLCWKMGITYDLGRGRSFVPGRKSEAMKHPSEPLTRTILFAWELGGGLGHLAPMLPLVRRFRERGYRLFMAVRDLSRVGSLFEGEGVSFLQAPVKMVKPRGGIALPRTFAHILCNNGFQEYDELRALCEAWRHLLDYVQPDLVLCDHSPTALLASRAVETKRATIGTGFCCPPDVYPWPDFRRWLPDASQQLRADEDRVLHVANQLLQAWGLRPLERMSQMYGEVDECFLTTFRELDHYPMRSAGRYWGAWPSSGGQKPVWPHGSGKRVFAYLNPFPTLPALLKLLRQLRVPALVYIDRLDPRLREHESETLRFAERRLDLAAVGRECDVAILNAGHGATVSMLMAGKPILQIPLTLEQMLTGINTTRMQAGLVAEQNQPRETTTRLTALLDSEQLAAGARRFANRYADFDPEWQIERVVERIDALLGEHAVGSLPISPRPAPAPTGHVASETVSGEPVLRPVSAPVVIRRRASDSPTTILLGVGTGCCGTKSLAILLSAQPSTAVMHQSRPLLPWYRSQADQDVRSRLMSLVQRFPQVARVGEVASSYLPHIREILQAFDKVRVICLRRGRRETIESFVRWIAQSRRGRPVNHWSADRAGFESDPWDACFPKYPTRDMAEAIGLYWDEYYALSSELAGSDSQRFRIFDTETLDHREGVAELLAFADVPIERQVLAPFGPTPTGTPTP